MTGRMVYLDEAPVGPSAKKVRTDYFGHKAQSYDEGRENDQKWLIENEAVRKCLGDVSGTVLDIPCGTGRFIGVCQELGLEVTARDVSPEMADQAKAKFPDVDIDYGDVLGIYAEDGDYDTVLCMRLLEKFTRKELQKALVELTRVAKDSVIFSLITGLEEQARNRSWVHDVTYVNALIDHIGFEVVAKHTVREPEYHVWHIRRRDANG